MIRLTINFKGDDIGRGTLPDVTYDDTEAGDGDDVHSLVLGVVTAFISIILLMAVAIILVCAYYR